MVPVVDPDPMATSALPTPTPGVVQRDEQDPRAGVAQRGHAAHCGGAGGVRAGPFLERVSPTPAADGVAAGDQLTPTDLALEAYQRALEPKRLVLLPGGHFDAYVKGFDAASGAAHDWFAEYLGPSR